MSTPYLASFPHDVRSRVRDLGGQVFNVQNPAYGAAGDGVTDDRPAIQKALDAAAAAGGGTVYFPPTLFGYRVTRRAANQEYALLVPSNVRLTGHRWASRIVLAAGQPENTFVIVLSDAQNVEIDHLTVDGNGTAQTDGFVGQHGIVVNQSTLDVSRHVVIHDCDVVNCAGSLIYAVRAEDVRVERCRLQGARGYGIVVRMVTDMTVLDNDIADCTGAGVQWLSSSGVDVTGARVAHNRVHGCGSAGIYVLAEDGSHVIGARLVHNWVTSCEGTGVRLTHGVDCDISHNYVQNVRNGGIFIRGDSTGVSIAHNQVDTVNGDGIYVVTIDGYASTPVGRVSLAHNHVRNASGYGIYANYVRNVEIDGGSVEGTAGTGIYVRMGDVSEGCTVRGVTLKNNASIGVYLLDADNDRTRDCLVSHCTFIDDQGVPTQTEGVRLANSHGRVQVVANQFAGTATPINLVGFSAAALVRHSNTGAGLPLWTTGTGTPQGVVTAPVGSLFLRTDGGAGSVMYVKESGTGNTGWVAK
jgi:Right handed beta helix region